MPDSSGEPLTVEIGQGPARGAAGPPDPHWRRSALLPSLPDLVFCLVAPVLAFGAAVRLTQSDGDLAAHIRVGQTILTTHAIPATSLVSYTVAGAHTPDPAWLAEIILALLYRLGGLALITCVVAMLAAGVHACAALFLRRRGLDPRWVLLATLMSLALGATHWLARPHLFTIAGVLTVVVLLESWKRPAALAMAPLFALWANLHGGWVYGLALIALYVVGDAIEWHYSPPDSYWRGRLRAHAGALAVATLAVLLNPWGPGLYLQVLGTLSGSAPSGMVEFRPPDFSRPEDAVLLLAILLSVMLLGLQRRRMTAPRLALLLGTLLAALVSGRNIALFGVSGWLVLALHSAHDVALPPAVHDFFADFARGERRTRVGPYAAVVGAALLVIGLAHGRIPGRQVVPDSFDASVFPVRAIERARAAALPGHTLLPWTWSGYATLAWPGQPLHVDPLKFSDETLRSYLALVELRPDWQGQLARWRVSLAVLPPRAPLAQALQQHGWQVWYRDATAVVLRPGAP